MMFRERKRWGFLGLPFTFTVYTVDEEKITIEKGLLNKTENDCYLYKVQDVQLKRSIWERLFGTGTIECYTGDVTDKNLVFIHIKNSKVIKDFIWKQSEEARMRRRTVNMQNITADEMANDIGDAFNN